MTDTTTTDAPTDASVTDTLAPEMRWALDQTSAGLLAADGFHDQRLTTQAQHDERARLRDTAIQSQSSAVADVAARAAAAADAAHAEVRPFDPAAHPAADVTAAWAYLMQHAFESERVSDWQDAVANATAVDLAAALRSGPASFRRRYPSQPERAAEAIGRLEEAVADRWVQVSGQREAMTAFEAAYDFATVAAGIAAQFTAGRVRQASDVAALSGAVRVSQTRRIALAA